MSLNRYTGGGKLKENKEWLYSTLKSIGDPLIATDHEGRIAFMNPAAESLTGLCRKGSVGKHIDAVLRLKNDKTGEDVKSSASQVLETGNDLLSTDTVLISEDGREVPVNNRAAPIKDGAGSTIGAVLVYKDITEKKRVDVQLSTLSRAVEQSPSTIVITDTLGKIEYVNPKFIELTGYTSEEVVGKTHRIMQSGKTPPQVYKQLWDTVRSGGEWRGELLNRKKDGELYWESAAISPIVNSEGVITNFLGIKQDISERKKTEYELKKLSVAIEKSANLVLITDLKGTVEYLSSMLEKITGYSKEEAMSFDLKRLTSSEMAKGEYEDIISAVISGKNWRGVYRNRRKDGTAYWISVLISPIKDDGGEVTHFLSIQEDITERKISEERIEYLATYDELTGLINRNRFIQLIDEWILFAHDAAETGGLLLIDIDNFKIVNDTFGHNIGDELLHSLSELLQKSLREYCHINSMEGDGSLIGRLGSDEIAVLLPSMDVREVTEVAEHLRKSIDSFYLGKLPAHITASIGIVLFPEHGATRGELFAKVDAALFRAKELGQNTCHLYLPEDRYLEEMHSRFEWKVRIQKALSEDRFEIWLQPIMNVRDKSIDRYEVLVRMRIEDGSIIPPGFFIGAAEIYGLIGAIDRVVAEKAMKLQAELSSKGKPVSMGLNLSGKDLVDDKLLVFLQDKIIESGADPAALHFEITETEAIHDLDRALKFVNKLRAMGCKFALDDFGAGFTSFLYLKKMSVDYIKLDGSFVKNLHRNKNDQLFVKALSDVARGMGIKTIAEFVEEKETLDSLEEFGVDYAQGYYIGKPLPANLFQVAGK